MDNLSRQHLLTWGCMLQISMLDVGTVATLLHYKDLLIVDLKNSHIKTTYSRNHLHTPEVLVHVCP